MIEAVRLRRARRRLRSCFFGSGLVLAAIYLLIAAFVVRLTGVEVTRYRSTVATAAGVLLGGSYGLFLFAYTGVHIFRRLMSGKPVVDLED